MFRLTRPAGVGLLALGAVIALAGCSSPSAAKPDTPTSTPTAGASTAAPAGGRGFGPAASGQIAAITGTTMQVQNQQTGQVAVRWTPSTKFTQQTTLPASSIKAGACVTAIANPGTSTTATAFTASTVSVRATTNGSCTGGPGGFGGGGTPPSGFPSGATRPSGLPSGFPTGPPSGILGNRSPAGRSMAIASGSVLSVSGSTLVVAARDFTPGSPDGTSTTNKTITLAPTTKITGQRAATASAVKLGRCATAQGGTDSSGAVTATTINITDPANGICTTGFGGFGGFGAGTNAAGSPGA